MRRVILAVLLAVLAALIGSRMAAERPAVQTAVLDTYWPPEEYNVLDLDRPQVPQTAGSTLLSELDSWYFSRTPTAKGDYTGLLAGKSLILLLAEQWTPEQADPASAPSLWRLESEGLCFQDVYAPDWYQGADGRLFALLTGLVPTNLGDGTALAWVGQQHTYLPCSVGTCLGGMGYACFAWPGDKTGAASLEALDFAVRERPVTDGDMLVQALPQLGQGPFAAFFVLTGADAEQTMGRLWRALADTGLEDDVLLCLLAEGGEPTRGSLTLWWKGAPAGRVSAGPCSELDVTATLLDLLGAPYDARFLSGRDLLAPEGSGAPVALGGSAYADWVTDAGRYSAAEERFVPADERFSGEQETIRYVLQMRQAVYEQYVYTRRAMERDYFRSRLGQ